MEVVRLRTFYIKARQKQLDGEPDMYASCLFGHIWCAHTVRSMSNQFIFVPVVVVVVVMYRPSIPLNTL